MKNATNPPYKTTKVQYSKGSIWNSSACWENDWCPESPRLSSHRRWSKPSYSTGSLSKDVSQILLDPLGPTSEMAQSEGPAIGKWEVHWLMTRINKANFRTILNGRLRSTFALSKERLKMSLAQRFLNWDIAQMIERPFRMKKEDGSKPGISSFPEKPWNRKTNYGKQFC